MTTARPHVVVIGDVVLDRDIDGYTARLCPDVPVLDVTRGQQSPGGAGLTALLCAASGAQVTLVAPVADDVPGGSLLAALSTQIAVIALGYDGATRCKTRVRSGGQSIVRIDEGGPGYPQHVPVEQVRAALAAADVVLVSDYGGGVTREPALRALLAQAAGNRIVVWDPHPRGGHPVPGVTLVTPNAAEARAMAPPDAGSGGGHHDVVAARLREAWDARAVCVTAGSDRAFLACTSTMPQYFPAPAVGGGDPCGAGDRFAASAAVVLAGGGTLVATGGCFDIVHAGHVATLQAARRLGGALVVLLNSDASVRSLKGPGRPVVTAADRAQVLHAFDCVDAVVIFDEDDPSAVLGLLRPDAWVKGGDYGATPLPEAEVVRRHGGRIVLLPYLDGRSTSTIIEGSGLARAQPA